MNEPQRGVNIEHLESAIPWKTTCDEETVNGYLELVVGKRPYWAIGELIEREGAE